MAGFMNKHKVIVAFLSPGWPLKAYPNGIVTYIKNIIVGFEAQVEPIIMTNKLVGECSESGVIDLLQNGKERNIVVKLCDRALSSKLTPKFLNYQCMEYKAYYSCWSIVTAVKSLEQKANILEVEESFGRAKFLVAALDIPVITRLHGPWFIHGPIMKLDKNTDYQYRVKAEGEAIKASHGVTAPSLDVLNRVREFYDLPLENAKVIPNPVPPVSEEKQWQYQPKKKQTILVVGRFDLHKGGDLAIAAFRLVAMRNIEVELLFVGPDRGVNIKGKSYSFSRYVESFVAEASVRKRINFLGHCDASEIANLRQKSSVTLMPSRYDNFPMSLLEAVAVGSPVVAADIGGMKEIITHEFNGLLAKPESPESMAENLLALLGDSERMKLISQNAIRDSRERFSPAMVAKQTEAYYRRILKI